MSLNFDRVRTFPTICCTFVDQPPLISSPRDAKLVTIRAREVIGVPNLNTPKHATDQGNVFPDYLAY